MAIKKFTAEEARQRKNARQIEYKKRTKYATEIKYQKERTKRYVLQVFLNTEEDIMQKLDQEKENGGYATYIKRLIREDINK